jgi:rhodanese-related sulfurtransferase
LKPHRLETHLIEDADRRRTGALSLYEDLSPAEFAGKRDADESWQLLDVREAWEIEIVSVPDSIRIPMSEVPQRHAELDKDRPVAVLCHSGVRSARVAEYLASLRFTQVANIAGGIDAWSQEVDNSLPRY